MLNISKKEKIMKKDIKSIIAFLLATLLFSACSSVKTPPSEQTLLAEETKQIIDNPISLDDQFLELSKSIPGFAGIYHDENGELKVLSATNGFTTQSTEDVSAKLSAMFGEQILYEQVDADVLEKALETQSLDSITVKDALISYEMVNYSFAELVAWRQQLNGIWEMADVNQVDIDEKNNRLSISVAAQKSVEQVSNYIRTQGIPDNAFMVDVQEGGEAGLSLRNNYPSNVGGLQLEFNTSSVCTLGFNARLGSTNGFVTNAHCGAQQGVVTPTIYRQGGNQIGREMREATMWTCGANRCRWADVAFARYDTGEAFELGGIAYTYHNSNARTEAAASASDLEVRDFERHGLPYRYKIIAGVNPVVGERVYKTGRTTGRTRGNVTATCVDIRQNGTNIVNRCQTRASYFARGGDSGSPVYKFSYYSNTGWRVELKGINWSQGGANIFSPISNVNAALGTTLLVTRPATSRTVYDGSGGGSPDFRQLTVAHTDNQVTIDIRFNRASDLANAGHNVYLYGTYRDTINFSRSNFSLRRDNDSNGHFETNLTSGSVTQLNSTTLRIQFRSSYLPDIHTKRVWAYSQTSRDRIPNSGHLQMQ